MYFRLFVKVIIIILCAYISLKCLNIITNNKTKEVTLTAISSTSKIIAKEIIGNRSIMNQYQIFLENNTTLSEQAKKQAEEFGHSFEREAAFLTVHSMLHLLGYDHEAGGDEEADMRRRQREILDRMGLSLKGTK